MNVEMPDGTIVQDVPDGMGKADLLKTYNNAKLKGKITGKPSGLDIARAASRGDPNVKVADILGGGLRGAGSIGASIIHPVDALREAKDSIFGADPTLSSLITGQAPMDNRQQMLARLDNSLTDLIGSNPDSRSYKLGKLGTEIAGTAGVGGLLSKGAMAIPMLSKYAPLLQSGGFNLGNAKTNSALANIALRTGSGAVTGGATLGLIDPSNTRSGVVIGGAIPGVGSALAAGGSKLGSALSNTVSKEVATLAAKAKQLGINIPLDRLTNSKALNAIASSLNYIPFSGRAGTEKAMENGLLTAVSRTFGQNTPNITQAVRAAKGDLGGQFDSFLTNNALKVDAQLTLDISQTLTKAERELNPNNFKIIQNQAQDLLDKTVNGVIAGQAGYNVKKALDRISKNSELAHYAGELRNNYFDGLGRSVGKNAALKFANLRQQYGNMKQIDKLAQNGAEGGVSIARLGNMRHINNQQLHDVADIAAQFVKSREGQHGAAQRVVMGAIPAAGWFGGGIPGGLAAAALAVGAGRALNHGILNSNTLKNAALGNAPQLPQLPQLLQEYGLLGIPSTLNAQ